MNKIRIPLLAALMILVAACASTPPQPKGPNLSGDWILTTESQMGAQATDMTVTQTGNQLAGTIGTPMGTMKYTGTLQGNQVAFGFMLNFQGMDLKIDYAGVVEGDTMKGKATFGQFGEGAFSAKRKTS